MSNGLFNLRKALSVFGTSPEELTTRGIAEASLPAFARSATDNRALKSWSLQEMPSVGEKVGFLKKLSRPLVASVFVTKGGVLKSSLTFNLARMAALHGIRTCVVGLDMQGDVSASLGLGEDAPDDETLDQALARMNEVRGLPDLFTGDAKLEEVIRPTDLPTLFYVPETPELVALDQSLVNRNRREYWVRDNVTRPLVSELQFDLVLMDCSPNWNRLITNALVASDILVSPLECKINNFRNLQAFRALIQEFKREMDATFEHLFVPTRLSPGRKLSQEIYSWYRSHLPGCTTTAIRETSQGEESIAVRYSIPEYAPASGAADEARELLREIWTKFETLSKAAGPQVARMTGASLEA